MNSDKDNYSNSEIFLSGKSETGKTVSLRDASFTLS